MPPQSQPQQQFRALTKQNMLSEYEMDPAYKTVKQLMSILFHNIHEDISFDDFPPDYKVFLYVPFPRLPDINRLYTFFARLTKPDGTPVMLWSFQTQLTGKHLRNIMRKPDALKDVFVQNIHYSPVQKQFQEIKKHKRTKPENILQRLERIEYKNMRRMDFLERRIQKLEDAMEHYSQLMFNKTFWQKQQQKQKQKTQQKQKCSVS